ncbi:MAG: DUF1365 domain-containing protein [Burkholderiaceae bacterium]|nr:MAG: DUF1365 domain-containing protein [Burkholderiaceae bacterium]
MTAKPPCLPPRPTGLRLLRGEVSHQRLGEGFRRFSYPMFQIELAWQDDQALLPTRIGPLALGAAGWMSWQGRDHGLRDGSCPVLWCREVLAQHGLQAYQHRVTLQCMPRVLGMGFNPVSFWRAYDEHGRLGAILAEVHNTFGEQHTYLLHAPDHRPLRDGEPLQATKCFHVSPFFDRQGHYRFEFHDEGGQQLVRIDLHREGQAALRTALTMTPSDGLAPQLWQALRQQPWLCLQVLGGIHWQALKLWRRGVRFFRLPLQRPERLSTGGPIGPRRLSSVDEIPRRPASEQATPRGA